MPELICPVCGAPVERDPDGAAVRCTGAECPAQLSRNIAHFVSRGAMDIEGLGEALVDQLIAGGHIHSPADIYYLQLDDLKSLWKSGTRAAQKLLDSGSATAEMLHFLTACIRYGVSVCIAGATGSGKTTIMAWLLSQVPDNRRLITIEEGSREFDLVKRDAQGNILNSVVHLLTRPSENPALNINQDFLLERVLRKHPDVIGVGEMRSAAESLSAAESSRTGHTVCTTIHSNSCNSTYRRMMTLAKRKYNMDDSILMQIMVEAYPIIVFTKQLEDRSRKIMEIIEGEDYQDGRLIAHSLYKYEVEDNVTDDRGETRVVGHHKKIGLISDSLKKRLLDNGISNKELEEFMQPPKEVG